LGGGLEVEGELAPKKVTSKTSRSESSRENARALASGEQKDATKEKDG